MAFGFLRKNNFADTIYFNGTIYTQDSTYPVAEAVACKDGRIMAVGDYNDVSEFESDDTVLIDLDGRFMFPGFINSHSFCALEAFDGLYANLMDFCNYSEIMEEIKDYADTSPDLDTILAFGFSRSAFDGFDDTTITSSLDQISMDTPLVILDDTCSFCKLNSTATKLVHETAEEECVEIITLPYILNLLLPFDYETLVQRVKDTLDSNADLGYTTVLTLQTPDYMGGSFFDALLGLNNEESIKQRFLGSLLAKIPVGNGAYGYRMMDKSTSCVELGDDIKYNFLNISLDDNTDFTSENLLEVVTDVADRGFNLFANCTSSKYMEMAYTAFNKSMELGNRKSVYVVGSDDLPDARFIESLDNRDYIINTWYASSEDPKDFGVVSSVEEAITNLTRVGAEIVGMSSLLGSIECNKYADFTIFDENPLDGSLGKFVNRHCVMTVLNDEIVYDAEEEAQDEMYDIITNMQL